MKNIQAKLQTFAGAMMVPIILLVLVGFFVGIGSAFTNYILPEGNILYNLFTMLSNLGFFFMNNLQLFFAVAIAFTLAKKEKGWAAFAGMIMYFCFMRGIEGWAALEGWTAETTTVEALMANGYTEQAAMNFNALWSSCLGIYAYNMGIFSGIIAGLVTAGCIIACRYEAAGNVRILRRNEICHHDGNSGFRSARNRGILCMAVHRCPAAGNYRIYQYQRSGRNVRVRYVG